MLNKLLVTEFLHSTFLSFVYTFSSFINISMLFGFGGLIIVRHNCSNVMGLCRITDAENQAYVIVRDSVLGFKIVSRI